ncbi:DUF305 domain-containing protein [Pontibacter sp. Tf4]|uniref:DUF305 domain-containing protein n=1 Tax=Pontibacter sp. Tf4 TaxID=2761620 RepID=UPI001626B79E|nr:DUF305 domain-containing protein [Pontibacter sp. Tf4]MBB6610547.1 DUF305 domain-containing protein [Pontibacter sp. Tf4]
MKNVKTNLQHFAFFAATTLTLTACGNESTTATTEGTTDMATEGQEQDTAMMTGGQIGGMMGHMHQNMQEMRSMRAQMTGDPDYDFALLMARHHQGGIRMADEEIANGTDSKLKEIAQRVKQSNQEEIQQLQTFTSKHTPTKADTATTMRMMHPMNRMMQQMHQQDMSGMNTDQNFAAMMVHHHQMGNEIAKEFLKTGKTQEMKQLAQKTIDQQTKEINELETWQQQNK